jgi:hypothetical protein
MENRRPGPAASHTVIILVSIFAVAAVAITAIVTFGGYSSKTTVTSSTARSKRAVSSTTDVVPTSTTQAPPPGTQLAGGPQPATPPPGEGGAWQLAPSSLANNPFGNGNPLPTGENLWISQDPNALGYFYAEQMALASAVAQNPGRLSSPDQGEGIVQNTNGN